MMSCFASAATRGAETPSASNVGVVLMVGCLRRSGRAPHTDVADHGRGLVWVALCSGGRTDGRSRGRTRATTRLTLGRRGPSRVITTVHCGRSTAQEWRYGPPRLL